MKERATQREETQRRDGTQARDAAGCRERMSLVEMETLDLQGSDSMMPLLEMRAMMYVSHS